MISEAWTFILSASSLIVIRSGRDTLRMVSSSFGFGCAGRFFLPPFFSRFTYLSCFLLPNLSCSCTCFLRVLSRSRFSRLSFLKSSGPAWIASLLKRFNSWSNLPPFLPPLPFLSPCERLLLYGLSPCGRLLLYGLSPCGRLLLYGLSPCWRLLYGLSPCWRLLLKFLVSVFFSSVFTTGFSWTVFVSVVFTSAVFVSAGFTSAALTSVAFTSAGLTSAAFTSAGFGAAGFAGWAGLAAGAGLLASPVLALVW